MGYRDETEGLRIRVADLEAQLAESNEKVARLTGEGPRIATGDQVKESALIGAPTSVVCERVLDFEIEESTFERIAEVVRPRLPQLPRTPQAQVAQVGRTLQGPGFFLESRDGRTRVRMEGDYRGLPAGALSCAGVGGGFFAMMAFAVAHDLFLRTLSEAHVLWMIPLAVLAFFPIGRAIAARSARKQQAHLRATFETVLEVARNGALVAAPAGVRVALPTAVAPADPRSRSAKPTATDEEAVAEVAAAEEEAVAQETGAQKAVAQETGARETGAQETGAQETGARETAGTAPTP